MPICQNSVNSRESRRNSLFMRACFCEPVSHTPVWLMRQAGRYMKEYNDIRSKVSFLELCKTPELACQVTVEAVEKIKADAAIIFSDILIVLEALGIALDYPGAGGPVLKLQEDLRSWIMKPAPNAVEERLSYVYGAIRLTRNTLRNELPLIGFAGAPFTLAAYAIEGGSSRTFEKTRGLMNAEPHLWKSLMTKLTQTLIPYLKKQIDAGADALQLFDTWAGYLSPEEYEKFVLPYSTQIIASIPADIPMIHFGLGTSKLLSLFKKAGSRVIGIDADIALHEAWKTVGYECAVQGNLDSKILLEPLPVIRKQVETILRQVGGRPGHIFNLGHGILPQTPVDHAIALIEMVHEISSRSKHEAV